MTGCRGNKAFIVLPVPWDNNVLDCKMTTKYRNQVSVNGYDLRLLKSGLQKYIRRGMTDKALYCAGEMDLFAYAKDVGKGEGLRTNFLHRLMIIFLEDIGNGNYHLWPYLHERMTMLLHGRRLSGRNRDNEVIAIKEVVTALSNSQKTRLASCLKAFSELRRSDIEGHEIFGEVLEYEYANPVEGLRESLKRKSIESVIYARRIFSKEELSIKVRNGLAKVEKGSVSNAMKRNRGQIIFDLLSEHMDVTIAREWFEELSTVKEQFLTWMVPLMHYLYSGPALHGIRGNSSSDICDVSHEWNRNILGETIDMHEEFVFDMHTKEGKKAGSDSKYFREESSRVLNESIDYWPRDLKNFYLAWREHCPPTLTGTTYVFVGDWKPPCSTAPISSEHQIKCREGIEDNDEVDNEGKEQDEKNTINVDAGVGRKKRGRTATADANSNPEPKVDAKRTRKANAKKVKK